MDDDILKKFLDECRDIADGLSDLGSKTPSSSREPPFKRNLVCEQEDYYLYHYQSINEKVDRSKQKYFKTILIVYSLINRATIVYLERDKSFVGDLLESGHDIYLLDWKEFGSGAKKLSLADYSFRFIDECVQAIKALTNFSNINLVGLCQGGVFSLLYALKHKSEINSLALISTPIDFKTEKDTMSKILNHLDLNLLKSIPYISGSMLNSFFNMLAPYSNLQKKYLTLLERQKDPEFVERFYLMENWRWDSPNVSGSVLAEFIDVFYIKNSFIDGTVKVNGNELKIGSKLNFPILNLYGLRDRLVPPESSQALSCLLDGEINYSELGFDCGHIGMYVGRKGEKSPGRTIGSWLGQDISDKI